MRRGLGDQLGSLYDGRAVAVNTADILVLLVVIAAVIGAILAIRRNRKAGKGCCGDCTACREYCNIKADA